MTPKRPIQDEVAKLERHQDDEHLFCALVGFWKAKTRAYSRGRFSLGSQGLVRQLLRPRNLPKRVRAAMSEGVSICATAQYQTQHMTKLRQTMS